LAFREIIFLKKFCVFQTSQILVIFRYFYFSAYSVVTGFENSPESRRIIFQNLLVVRHLNFFGRVNFFEAEIFSRPFPDIVSVNYMLFEAFFWSLLTIVHSLLFKE